MHKGPWSPLIGVKDFFLRGNMGLVGATSHNYPLIMSFSVEENAVFTHKFSKNLPTVGGGHPPPPSLTPLARARSLRSLAYYRPPLRWNPGYATAYHYIKPPTPPPPPSPARRPELRSTLGAWHASRIIIVGLHVCCTSMQGGRTHAAAELRTWHRVTYAYFRWDYSRKLSRGRR